MSEMHILCSFPYILYKCAERTKGTNCHKQEDILHQIYISPNGVGGFKQENENIENVFVP
jgi:hypothetical protein